MLICIYRKIIFRVNVCLLAKKESENEENSVLLYCIANVIVHATILKANDSGNIHLIDPRQM